MSYSAPSSPFSLEHRLLYDYQSELKQILNVASKRKSSHLVLRFLCGSVPSKRGQGYPVVYTGGVNFYACV